MSHIEHATSSRAADPVSIFTHGIREAYRKALLNGSRGATDDDLLQADDAQRRALELAGEGRLGAAVRCHNFALEVLGQRSVEQR